VPDRAAQTDVETKPSLEEVCPVTVESKPVTEEKEAHEEVREKGIQPTEPGVFQEDIGEKLETAEHPEHTETEADMTGGVYSLCVIGVFSLYILISFIVNLFLIMEWAVCWAFW
jgi:hypothetical protein